MKQPHVHSQQFVMFNKMRKTTDGSYLSMNDEDNYQMKAATQNNSLTMKNSIDD